MTLIVYHVVIEKVTIPCSTRGLYLKLEVRFDKVSRSLGTRGAIALGMQDAHAVRVVSEMMMPTVQHKEFVPDNKLEGRFDNVVVSKMGLNAGGMHSMRCDCCVWTRDKADLVISSNALVSADTGTILPTVQQKAFVPDKKLEGRFDKVNKFVNACTRLCNAGASLLQRW
jgi:signal peptidase I